MAKFKSTKLHDYLQPYFFVAPAILILIGLMLYPVFKVIQFSFYDNVIITQNSNMVGLKNYIMIFKEPLLYESFQNTVFFTLGSVALHALFGFAFALLLNQPINKKIMAGFRGILILPWVFTAVVVAIIWRLMLDPMGVVNFILLKLGFENPYIEWFGSIKHALPSLIAVNAWFGYPFSMISFLAGLQSIPNELYEAAMVDGANNLQKIIYITIPQLKTVILNVLILDTIWTFREFPLIWLTTGGGPIHATEMLSTYTYKKAFEQFQFGQASVAAVLILLVTIAISVFYVRQQKLIGE